ncbi:MAG: phenylacetate--CoA ligase family protein [bacterium]
MDLIKILAQRVSLPFSYYREGFDIMPRWRELEKSQYFSEDEMHDLQWRRLKTLLSDAYVNVPYYSELFDREGIRPGDINNETDFRKIPVLTKQDIRDHHDRMVSKKYDPGTMIPKKTGGSTGVPLKLYWSRGATAHKKAATLRHDAWTGYRPGEKLAMLWGAEPGDDTWRFKLYNFLTLRRIALDTLQMSDATTGAFLTRLRKYGAPFLFGHAHSLYVLAQYVDQNGITDLPTRSILSTAEVLTPKERQQIERAFGVPLFDRYGCEELSVIASECEAHEGLHVHSEGLYIELEGSGEQEPGDLIITDLVNDGMPLIRYKTEDMALPLGGRCSCGRTLPRLKTIFGRHTDFLYTPDGRSLSGISIMVNLAIEIPGIWQVQVVQDRLDHLLFRIVRTDQFGEHSLRRLAQEIPKFFGSGMNYDVEYVEALSRTPRGKYQFSICKIPRPEASS